MLNGKFYTGLPPDMMAERSNANRNRMQSSIFWPDDTKVDSAIEARVKRRTSLQLDQTERPRLRAQASVGDNDVNTRQMFQKEFSKSSIQFHDNLQEQNEGSVRKPLLRTIKCGRSDVTPKPTALKLPLPENVVNASYTNAKKKQAFTSKIEFCDNTGDELNQRNNARPPKMDMNDKREMEKNTKNSPKLQVKNNMRNLSMVEDGGNGEQQLELNAEEYAQEPQLRRTPQRAAPVRRLERNYNENLRNYGPVRDTRRERRVRVDYEEDVEVPLYQTEHYNFSERSNNIGRSATVPRRILKNPIHDYDEHTAHDDATTYNDYRDDAYYNNDDYADYVEQRMRDVRIRTSPKKHVTYSDEIYDDDEMTSSLRSAPAPARSRLRTTNMTAGSNQRQRDLQYNNCDDLGLIDVDDDEQQLTTPNSRSTIKSLNNNSSNNRTNNAAKHNRYKNNNSRVINDVDVERNNNNRYANKLQNNNRTAAARKVTPKMPSTTKLTKPPTTNRRIDVVVEEDTPAAAAPDVDADAEAANDVKKHLRSSLCLHNGEIVATNDDAGGSGGTTTKAPTRNARTTSTRQRVSVGLPD